MARYSRYGNHGSKPFPEYSILSNNWLIIYEAISKGRRGNDHLADLVNFSFSITLKCLISENMIPNPLPYLAVFGMSKSNKPILLLRKYSQSKIEFFSYSARTKIHLLTFIAPQ